MHRDETLYAELKFVASNEQLARLFLLLWTHPPPVRQPFFFFSKGVPQSLWGISAYYNILLLKQNPNKKKRKKAFYLTAY